MNKSRYDTTGLPELGIWQLLEGSFLIRPKGDENPWIALSPGEVYLTRSAQPCEILLPGFEAGRRVRVRGCGVRASIYNQIDLCEAIDLPMVLSPREGERLTALVLEMLDAFMLPAHTIARSIRLQAAEGQVLRQLFELGRVSDFGRRIEQADPRMIRALAFMEQNANRLVCIDDLARHLHLSESRFKTLFKEVFGASPMRFHLNMRLENVARQLLQSDRTVEEIALATGFSSAFHLSREFKKHYGLPPRDFRKRYAEG